jgi:hypothetical protein
MTTGEGIGAATGSAVGCALSESIGIESTGGDVSIVATAARSESRAVSATATRTRRRAAIPESTTVVRVDCPSFGDNAAMLDSPVPRLAAHAPQPRPMQASTPAPFHAYGAMRKPSGLVPHQRQAP